MFVQDCVRNQVNSYDRFNAVVLLSAPAEVILERIARRTTNEYDKDPAERDLILYHLETIEVALRADCTHEVDANRSLDDVVARD